MLKTMRRNAKIFYVLFVLIIITFIFWGVAPDDSNNRVVLANVGEEEVSIQEYWTAFDRTEGVYRDTYKDQYDQKMRDNLKQQVLAQLVDQRLLAIAAVQSGITVTDQELTDSITHESAFVRDGAFNKDVYMNVLRLNRLTPERFEEVKRRDILVQKMVKLIDSTVDLSDNELSGLSADADILATLKESILDSKRQAAMRSYVEGLKKFIPVTMRPELI